MATYNITAVYEYAGEIEADSPEEAEAIFLKDLNDYYSSTESLEIEKLGECVVCGEVDSNASEDFTCDVCAMDKSQESYSWSEMAELTHKKQVEIFGWCGCEEKEHFPYDDCPREGE